MEVNLELAEKIQRKYGAQKSYDNAIDLLHNKDVDAVYIASPVTFHMEQIENAVFQGKSLLIEKPICLTADEGFKVVNLCKEKNILAATGFMMRYHPYHQKMKEIVKSGKLGQIVSCRAQLTCWYPDMPGNWRQKKETADGGSLMDLGVHCIDLLQHITGGNAKKVAALIGTKTFNYEVEDSASIIFETDQGANCYVDVNFNIPDAAAKCRIEIYGTRGSMLAEGTIGQVEGGKLDVVLSDEKSGYDAKQDRIDVESVKIDVEFGNMYTKEIESFSQSILDGSSVEVPIADAVQVQRVVEAAYESAEKGVFINL
jgi:predicted dehydrogenase